MRPTPVCTSSKISNALCLVQSSRTFLANSSVGEIIPPSPCNGSIITAHVLSLISASNAAISLKSQCTMSAGLGPKPSEYAACPPTVTVKNVRP